MADTDNRATVDRFVKALSEMDFDSYESTALPDWRAPFREAVER